MHFASFVLRSKNIEIVGLAAAVALLRTEIAEARGVGDLRAVGRKIARARLGHGQDLGRAAGHRDRVESREAERPRIALRPEEDRLSVHSPAVDLVVPSPPRGERASGRIVGELPGDTAGRRHDIDLLVAVVLAGEGDPFAVGREPGEHLDARVGGEPGCRSAGNRSDPDVAGIGEGYFVAVNRRKAKQFRLCRRRSRSDGRDDDATAGSRRLRVECVSSVITCPPSSGRVQLQIVNFTGVGRRVTAEDRRSGLASVLGRSERGALRRRRAAGPRRRRGPTPIEPVALGPAR